ncbi:class I SAM-dependent methyltransferase [Neorhodopirellula lusitana]|uniref:class I SAM-dependent methyltransferase n=1 Tax=Neorhodopirellula lusitana TaxID=445327 RepID=UPI00384CFF18
MTECQLEVDRASFASRMKAVFQTWLHHPASVASVCPSSSVLTEQIADRESVRQASLVVDLGPATGETSVALLKHMKSNGKLLAVEKMLEFIAPLNEIQDDRLIVHHGDAGDLGSILRTHALGRPDVIVSGVPFSTIDEASGRRIVAAVHEQLRDGGRFLAYQVRDEVAQLATPLFGSPMVEKVHLNVPPLTIYTWTKSSAG